MTAQAIDDVLAGTFPASDPPAWTPGIARLAPEAAPRPVDKNTRHDRANGADVIDVSRPPDSTRTFARALVSLTGAIGVVLLVPVAILAVGTPVALGVRGVLELAERLAAILR